MRKLHLTRGGFIRSFKGIKPINSKFDNIRIGNGAAQKKNYTLVSSGAGIMKRIKPLTFKF